MLFNEYLTQAEKERISKQGQTNLLTNTLDKIEKKDASFDNILPNALFDKLLEYHDEKDYGKMLTKKEFFISLKNRISINKVNGSSRIVISRNSNNLYSCKMGDLVHEDLIVLFHMYERIPLNDDTLLNWPEDDSYLNDFICLESRSNSSGDYVLQSESYDILVDKEIVNDLYGKKLREFDLPYKHFHELRKEL